MVTPCTPGQEPLLAFAHMSRNLTSPRHAFIRSTGTASRASDRPSGGEEWICEERCSSGLDNQGIGILIAVTNERLAVGVSGGGDEGRREESLSQ